MYLREMVWLRKTFSDLHEKGITATQSTHASWTFATKNMNSAYRASFFRRHAAIINENRFNAQENLSTADGDVHFFTKPIKLPNDLYQKSFRGLYKVI